MGGVAWNEKSRDVYGAVVTIRVKGEVFSVALRVDGRGSRYRVDVNYGLGPWEAIDEGRGYETAEDARRCAESWVANLHLRRAETMQIGGVN